MGQIANQLFGEMINKFTKYLKDKNADNKDGKREAQKKTVDNGGKDEKQ